MNRGIQFIAAIVLVGIFRGALARAADFSTPTQALHAFIRAEETGDANAWKQCTFNVDPELIDLLGAGMADQRALEATAAAKFANSRYSMPTRPKSVAELADQAERDFLTINRFPIVFKGNDATLALPNGKGFKFRSFNGQWKVNGDALFNDPLPEIEMRDLIVMRIVMKARIGLVQDVAAGVYPNWPAVQSALRSRIAEAVRESSEYQAVNRAVAEAEKHRLRPGGASSPLNGGASIPFPGGSNEPQPRPAGTPFPGAANAAPRPGAIGGAQVRSQNDDGFTGERTAMIGGKGGGPFTQADSQNQPVIGFRYSFGNWNRQVLKQLDPLVQAPSPQHVPGGLAREADGSRTLLARPGFVVGGLIVDTDNVNVVAVRVVFMKYADGKIEPKVKYLSNWIGIPSHIRLEQLGGNGKTVIGVFGHKGLNLDAVGLLLKGAAGRTARLGGSGGSPFMKPGPSGSVVVGFRYELGNWDRKVIGDLDPIFRDNTTVPAAARGDGLAGNVVLARDGYVVSGLLVDTDDTNTVAVRVHFVRLKGGLPDPRDAYQSDWIGIPSNIHQQNLDANPGEVVVGTYGRKGANLDGLGLLIAPPPANFGRDIQPALRPQ